MTHAEEGVEAAGAFQVDLSYRYVDQTKMLDGSHATNEVLVPKIDFEDQVIEPDHHLEISTRNTMVRLGLAAVQRPKLPRLPNRKRDDRQRGCRLRQRRALRLFVAVERTPCRPGIRFGPGKQLELYAYLQIPVYQDVDEAQLAPRFGFIVGLSKRF